MTPTEDAPVLVFGDDGSPGADVAWLWINSHVWEGWRLSVLRAQRPPIGMAVDPALAAPHPMAGADPRPSYAEAQFSHIDFLEATGDPRVVLTGDLGADLLVVGPASSGIGRWHLGSTTEWLLHDPPVPVLLPRHGRPVERVLVAADPLFAGDG